MKEFSSKLLYLLGCCIITVLAVMVVSVAVPNSFQVASATTDAVDISIYVDSDNLVNDSSQTIQSFAETIKHRDNKVNNTELKQIIPKEYLSFKENNYTFGYNGKEYGFFVKHRLVGNSTAGFAKLIDVIVIDFTYLTVDTVCKFKAQIIIQETFTYTKDLNGENWLRIIGPTVSTDKDKSLSGEYRKTYYISKPSFFNMIQNENEANYGDSLYDKKADNGAIIYQTRLNYQGVQVVDDGITIEEADAIMDSVLTIAEDVFLDMVSDIPIVGEVIGIVNKIRDIVDLGIGIANAVSKKQVEIPCNRESDIFQEQSKNTQRNNNLPSYSRAAIVSPRDDILVSGHNGGFVSCNTLLNDSTCATRVHQLFEFDLMSSDYLDATKNLINEKVKSGDNERSTYYAYKRTVLFKDTSIKNINDTGKSNYYLLEYGEQSFRFNPRYTGEYLFETANNNAVISVDGKEIKDGTKITLTKGKTINIVLHSSNSNISGLFRIKIATLSNKTVTLNSKSNYIAKYVPSETAIFTFNGNGCQTTIYDESKNILDTFGTASAPLIKNKTYYVVYENKYIDKQDGYTICYKREYRHRSN